MKIKIIFFLMVSLFSNLTFSEINSMTTKRVLIDAINEGEKITMKFPNRVLSLESRGNSKNYFLYKFEREDTIFKIAKKFKISHLDILSLNMKFEFSNGDIIKVPYKNSKISILPPIKNMEKIRVSSFYGLRNHPILHYQKLHKGIDFAVSKGTKIYAVEDGTVIFSEKSGGYGNLIKIDHGEGYMSAYAHLNSFVVESGDVVSKGTLIAYSGNTGRSTGPHLHFEMRKYGNPINPVFTLDYFKLALDRYISKTMLAYTKKEGIK